jgi:hypothetical protein
VRLEASAAQAWTYAQDLVAGIFVELRYVFHQDIFVKVPGLPSRSVTWIVAALVIAGVCFFATRRRTAADWVLAAWILAAALPAIFSDRAYPKRAATLFPALFIVAGAAADEALRDVRESNRAWRTVAAAVAAAGLAGWFCATTDLWFSGDTLKYGKPNEQLVAERVIEHLEPGTIVIANLWHEYGRGKLTYLLSTALQDPARQPVFWYVTDWKVDLRELLDQPERATGLADAGSFSYRWAGLESTIDAARRNHRWTQAIFVLQQGVDTADKLRVVRTWAPAQFDDDERIALVRQRYPDCEITRVPAADCGECGYVIARCRLGAR